MNGWLFLVPITGGIGSIFDPPGSARTFSVVKFDLPPEQ